MKKKSQRAHIYMGTMGPMKFKAVANIVERIVAATHEKSVEGLAIYAAV